LNPIDPLNPKPPPAWVFFVLLSGALVLASAYARALIQSWRAISEAFGANPT